MTLSQSSISIGNWLFIRRGWLPLLLYVLATFAILCSSPDHIYHWSFLEEIAYLLISCLGLVVRGLTIGYTPMNTSGRNTKEGQVADSLNTLGMYSMIRHPLYVGNFLMWLGLILYVGVDWYIPVIILLYWWYYEKIVMAEEDFLSRKFGDQYTEWCNKTNAFIPNFGKWKKPEIQFSTRNVVKREYHGVFYLMLSFLFINVLRNFALGQEEIVSRFWEIGFIVTAIVCIIIRVIVKKTDLLQRAGR